MANSFIQRMGDQPFHPLLIVILNLLIPMINTVYPSQVGMFSAIAMALVMLLMTGRLRRFRKALTFVLIFVILFLSVRWIAPHSVLQGVFLMFILFLPMVMMAMILISDYTSSELVDCLQLFHLPKVFVIALTVTLRYIPTFSAEMRLIRQAMKARQICPRRLSVFRRFEYWIVPQLFRCLVLSEELTAAALMKGVRSLKRRTSYLDRHLKGSDLFGVLLWLFWGILSLWGYHYGF